MLTYFTFLLLFIGIPLVIISILYLKKYQQGEVFQRKNIREVLIALAILIVVAFVYTTPWDNYLVQNAIWYYESSKVIGIIIGYVPIEEYTFFIVQTLLIGLIFGWGFLDKNNQEDYSNRIARILSSSILLIIWFISFFTFIKGIESLTYLNLILLWSIPPILLQLIYGADILWSSRYKLTISILVATIYLAAADALAIYSGIWTISINTSTGINLGGILPIEEFLFFLVTNILIIFGLTLIIDSRSRIRGRKYYSKGKKIISADK